MAWSVERIESELLQCKLDVVALPAQVVIAAVNRVEQVLGVGWIEGETSSAKGIAPAMQIIGMGLRLASLDNVPGSDRLISNLRVKEQNAEAELTGIHVFRSFEESVLVELEPMVGSRKADFRVKESDKEKGTIVEVTQPGSSEERRRAEQIVRRMTGVFEKSEKPFSLNIEFLRVPSDDEVEILCARLPEFTRLSGHQSAHLVNGLGFMFLNHVPIGHLLLPEITELADTPMIGVAAFFSGGAGGGPHHQVLVRVPFTDGRAEEILRDEAKQLSKNEPGLVMINVSANSKELRAWRSLIERRFQPVLHTRVSGVCLFSGGMVPVDDKYKWLLQTDLVLNPHAKNPLPEWIQTAIKAGGVEFESALAEQPVSPESAI